MKKTRFLLNLVSLVGLVGCTLATPTSPTIPTDQFPTSPQLPTVILVTQTSAVETPTSPGLTVEMLGNSTYTVPYYQKVVKLTNGLYEEGTGNDYLRVSLLPQIAFGDLNKDGIQDAAFLLAENGGGSGTFVSLGAVLEENGGLVQISNFVSIDDRPVIEDLAIKDSMIAVTALIHSPNIPMATPTLETSQGYMVMDGALRLVHMTTTPQGAAERSIDIEVVTTYADKPKQVELKGSMPIAPFENTLGYFVTDSAGNQLATGSFMVDAKDVGGPATFDHTFDLTGIPSGTKVHLSIFEGDMSGFHLYNALEMAPVFTVK